MSDKNGIGFDDFADDMLEASSEAPPSDFWSPTEKGAWLMGEIASTTEITLRARSDDEKPRQVTLYRVYGKTGADRKSIPRQLDDLFDTDARLVPFTDSRVGMARVMGLPVEGADRRGAAVGDLVLIRLIGKQGNSFIYGAKLAALAGDSHVPAKVLAEAKASDERASTNGAGKDPAADGAGDDEDLDDRL